MSMNTIIEVATYDEFTSFIEDFLDKHSDRDYVYRGQNKDYPFVPSMKRQTVQVGLDVPLTIFHWESLISNALEEVGVKKEQISGNDYRLMGMALLQHYGYRSWFIDVTKNSEIALWFALNNYSKGISPILNENRKDFHPLLQVPTSWYSPTDLEEGYFYIIDVTDSEGIYFDLTKLTPHNATRVAAQEAGALFEPNGRKLDDLVAVRIKLTGAILKHAFRKHTYDSLFPSYRTDPFYRFLLALPYFVPTDQLVKHCTPAFPIVSVPLYKHNAEEVINLGSMIKVLVIPSFFSVENGIISGLKFDTIPTCQVNGKEFRFNEALQILFPQYPSKKPVPLFQLQNSEKNCQRLTDSSEVTDGKYASSDLRFWPSNNLLILYPLSPLFLPLDKSEDQFLPKGFWVVFDGNELYISRFGFEGTVISLEGEMHYLKEEQKYQINPHENDCSCGTGIHMTYLKLFLFINYALEVGNWIIGPYCRGHRHLIPNI